MKKSVLFVDDEPGILDGLRLRLRPQRQRWDMYFAAGGEQALAALGVGRYDVLVTDMRMPGIDGAALLQEARQKYPGMARIVLSGYAEKSALLRALSTAHQYLPKPCPPGLLEDTIERVAELQALIHDDAVKAAVGQIAVLPAQPAVYSELLAALTDDGAFSSNLADILRRDAALSLRVLQIVNSAYFRPPHQVLDIGEAVHHLGLDTIRQLALVAGVFGEAGDAKAHPELPLAELHRQAVLAGAIAATLCDRGPHRQAAFVAGLLHDIGKLALTAALPERLDCVGQAVRSDGRDLATAERECFGVTHAEIGGYLLGLWQLPFPIVEAVANHHAPARVRGEAGLGLVAAVHVADALAREFGDSAAPCIRDAAAGLDLEYLKAAGLLGELPRWREQAAELAASQRGLEVSLR